MPDAKITSNTILVIDNYETDTKQTTIRVVEWIINDDKTYRLLEKRESYKKDDQWRMGKAKGFSIQDLGKIQEKWDEIIDALSGKKAEPEKEKTPF